MDLPASLAECRARLRAHHRPDETSTVRALMEAAKLSPEAREAITVRAIDLVETARKADRPTIMEDFLGEYGLGTKEGIALMQIAEALLRVPDDRTVDALIDDKIGFGDWGAHWGRSGSPLVNAATGALMLTGGLMSRDTENPLQVLKSLVKRLGEPVVRASVTQAMRIMGGQFVLGRTIDEAMKRAEANEKIGYSHSYDMLGEAARTAGDAERYFEEYSKAIRAIAKGCKSGDVRENPGVSVKLSALHPRYEVAQRDRVMAELAPRCLALAKMAAEANMGFNIDAEEADRLDLSLDVIETVLRDPALEGWDGFGVVVQGYGPRCAPLIDWLYSLANSLDRKLMVRLVKGAYWDAEIKRAQVEGVEGFPVFTRKAATDVSYIACARKLMRYRDRIYPQFATHNAHSAAAILHLADEEGLDRTEYEFQRLHGMGERLHEALVEGEKVNCRIYAPAGQHRDLLAYLVRRLLENGANGSFVHQIADKNIHASDVARDPFTVIEELGDAIPHPAITPPPNLFAPERANAKGWDLTDPDTLYALDGERGPFRTHRWEVTPDLSGAYPNFASSNAPVDVRNPANPEDIVGTLIEADADTAEAAIALAETGFTKWTATPVAERAAALKRAAALYEKHAPELFALAAREAGKSLPDAVAEIREAVDFLNYYAHQAETASPAPEGRGVFACISPWNFPLAIFTGQLTAALAAGNAVIAKPAEQTPLIAARAVQLLHEAGVPADALIYLPGPGEVVGAALTADPRIAGICFTGSTDTAKLIDKSAAEHLAPDAPLIAETGGLNAMIIDSTALPEQAVDDVIASAFQSSGQRCSALRILYIQEDIADRFLGMLYGAMDELRLGDPWLLSTDIGPVIDDEAFTDITGYLEAHKSAIVNQIDVPETGTFVPPSVIEVSGIEALEREVFGPVLHVARFAAKDLDKVIAAVNAKGFGLTFGLHSRIARRADKVAMSVKAGNVYVNRNQIGAIVGSQPFGGEGLSGTGPKAGGPHYLPRFAHPEPRKDAIAEGPAASRERLDLALADLTRRKPAEAPVDATHLPGPTGESNILRLFPRGVVLCLGPDAESLTAQAEAALNHGDGAILCAPGAGEVARSLPADSAVVAVDGSFDPAMLGNFGIEAVACFGSDTMLKPLRMALAERKGPILPLITDDADLTRFAFERHCCIDTTASGGNAALLASL